MPDVAPQNHAQSEPAPPSRVCFGTAFFYGAARSPISDFAFPNLFSRVRLISVRSRSTPAAVVGV